MTASDKKNGVWLLIGPVVFYLMKYLGPVVIAQMYDRKFFPLLNLLTAAQGEQPLGFYLGNIEQFILGPLSLFLAGWIFLKYALIYLRDAGKKKFGFAVFVFLVLTRPEVLFFPVYGGDAIIGPWAEGIWLARNNFDYLALAKEPGYTLGGPKTYLFSIYPGFLALQMVLFRIPQVFLFLNHFFALAMISGVIALFREILQDMFDGDTAILGSLVLLSFPLIQAQSEMINMEMPCMFFAFLSAYFLFREHLVLAAGAAILSALVKKTGAISCIAVFVVCLAFFLFVPKYRRRWPVLVTGLWALLSGATVVLASMKVVEHVGVFKFFSFRICKDAVFYFFLAASLLTVSRVVVRWRKDRRATGKIFTDRTYAFWAIAWVYAALWFFLFMIFTDVAPRYKLLVYPFLFFVVLFAFWEFVSQAHIRRRILAFVMAGLLLSVYGFPWSNPEGYQYIQLERSLEYRTVMERDKRLMREIQKSFAGFMVVSPPVTAQILALPELGYVCRPFKVAMYQLPASHFGIINYVSRSHVNPAKTIWLTNHDNYDRKAGKKFPYPLDRRDRILEEVVFGGMKTTIFQGGYAIDRLIFLQYVAYELIKEKKKFP